MKRKIASVMILAAALSACSGEKTPTGYPIPSPLWSSGPCPTTGGFERTTLPLSSSGSIQIVEPGIGDVVRGDTVVVKANLTGACIVDTAQRTVRPDTGHIHISLDGTVLTNLAGLRYEIPDVEPGTHLVQAEFFDASHAPFQPRVLDTVSFKVAKR